ncbi:MAG TPA: hypothetical protein VMS43_05655 [Allosphingosinicella sp.]|nr:hypothetical protein [Allosphingosinicella sp.]
MPAATEASARAGFGDSVIGWKLDSGQRAELLLMFPPKYPNAVADHVTLRSKAASDAALPDERDGEIVGRADDGEGVEAMVVRIDGTADRPDGSIYHVTWSLEAGREAKESNDVIAALGWTPFDLLVPVALIPARFR